MPVCLFEKCAKQLAELAMLEGCAPADVFESHLAWLLEERLVIALRKRLHELEPESGPA